MSQPTYTNKSSHFFSLLKQSLQGKEHDYTGGSIRSAIVLLAIPMILELSLESVFAVVDMFFVGKLGANAITTVGLTESVMAIVYSMAMGLSMAATAVVARRIGEKNQAGASHAGAQSILAGVVIIVIISIAGYIFAADILRLMGAHAGVIKEGTSFTRIMFASSSVIVLLFLINGIFRGAGDAAMAMKSLLIASLINIILCPVLINGYGPFPALGLEGAAIATVIGRGTGVLYQCYHLFLGKGTIKIKAAYFKWNLPIIKTLANIAGPATLQFIIQSGSWIVLALLVSLTGGTDASAGYQIAIRNVVFFILPAWGLSNAAATLVGQNLGAKQPLRAEQSVWLATKYNAIFMGVVSLVFLFFASPIIGVYTKEAEVHKYGVQALQIIGSGYIFYGIGMVMIQALNGAGDSKTPTWINLFCFWLFQIPFAFILSKPLHLGPMGSFIAIPVAETTIALVAYYYFKKGKWKQIKV